MIAQVCEPPAATVAAPPVEQTPRMHVSLAAQARPQAPQFALSVCVFAQVGEGAAGAQSVSTGAQAGRARQSPATQVSPAAQARPQAPQFAALVCVFTQVGAGAVGVQSVSAEGHVERGVPHTPAMQG